MEPAVNAEPTRDVARYARFLKTGEPGTHAYVVLLGLESFDLPAVLKSVEKGFPWKSFERLAHNFGLPQDRIAEMAAIPRRTLARRKNEKRFTAGESDRLLRTARVFAMALRLFDGDRDAAVEWLTTLENALGTAPSELMSSDVGTREVERILGALEHGVFL